MLSCVLDGRMRRIVSSLSEGHVTADDQPPNMTLTPPSHPPGGYTGNTQTYRNMDTSATDEINKLVSGILLMIFLMSLIFVVFGIMQL